MAASLSGSLKLDVGWTIQGSNDFTGYTPQDTHTRRIAKSFTNGTGSEQVEDMYVGKRTVTPSTPNDDIDLTALTNPIGGSVAFTKIKEILIVNLSTTSGDNLLMGAAASNAWTAPFDGSATATLVIPPGGWPFYLPIPIDGFTVTDSSSDTLRIAHDGGASDISYDIQIKGLV